MQEFKNVFWTVVTILAVIFFPIQVLAASAILVALAAIVSSVPFSLENIQEQLKETLETIREINDEEV